jgi:glycosyltransferase involved in cell wall biosynthesis
METLPTVIRLLRGQTMRPYIVLIDTGSSSEQWQEVQALRAHDIEVHQLWTGGLYHSSAVVASALDLAVSLCRTEVLLFTHTDCFLRRRDAVEQLFRRISPEHPFVGYGITPRENADDWKRFVGHVWSGIHVPTIRSTAARWGHNGAAQTQANWDTEYSFNRTLISAGIRPIPLGYEENWKRNVTPDYEHVRSYPLSALYRPDHHSKAQDWMKRALRAADARLWRWQQWDRLSGRFVA